MSLAPDLRRALTQIAATPRLLVCSDYDGTLAPIVDDPEAAWPLAGAIEAVSRLAEVPSTTVALLSGRARATLAALSGTPPGVLLVGTHGLELGADVAPATPAEDALRARIDAAVADLARGVAGVLLEEKPTGVAVHVRRCEPAAGDALLDAVSAGPGTWPGVHLLHGKRVVELSVRSLGKGAAVAALAELVGATATLVVGDDVTDEDAFAAVADGRGRSVKVGPGPTRADHRVDDPADVVALLDMLRRERTAGRSIRGSSAPVDG